MNTISENLRELVLNTLDFIADKEGQLKYQQRMPAISVSSELINQWDDCYHPGDRNFQSGFTAEELEALARFDEVLNAISDSLPQQLPSIEEFSETDEWQRLSTAAGSALKFFDK